MRRVLVLFAAVLTLVGAGGTAPATHPEGACSAAAEVAVAPDGPSCAMTLSCPGAKACFYDIQASFSGIGQTHGRVAGGDEELTTCDSPPLVDCTVFIFMQLLPGEVLPVVCSVTGGLVPVVLTPSVSCEAFALGHAE